MANTLGVYNPIFYANEALIHLERALGLAARVHKGYDAERKSFGKGQTISIRKPSVLTAANAPATAEDLTTEYVDITLDQWKEVKFKLSDKELAYTGQRIIDEHIRPAAYALADNVDQALVALYKSVPWAYDGAGDVVTDFTGTRKVLFDNGVPLDDPGALHFMMGSSMEANMLALAAFSQQQGAGDAGVSTQMRGHLGTKYGFETFSNQNVASHTGGVCADPVGALTAATAVGDTTIAIDAVTVDGTCVVGDIIEIAGDTQLYVCTADDTFTGGVATISVYPAIKQINADNAVVTITVTDKVENLGFHRNAFALAMAPLSDMAKELGARVATITDPITGLSIRSRVYYVGNSSEVHVALDVLYGVKTLDGNLACRNRV